MWQIMHSIYINDSWLTRWLGETAHVEWLSPLCSHAWMVSAHWGSFILLIPLAWPRAILWAFLAAQHIGMEVLLYIGNFQKLMAAWDCLIIPPALCDWIEGGFREDLESGTKVVLCA